MTQKMAHVVIVGAGFGGLAAATRLARAPVAVTLVDRRNHHLFQPLLYQVATAALSPADIASATRNIMRRHQRVRTLLGQVDDVDPEGRRVLVDGRWIGWDYLILATGARHGYFGHDEWQPFAPGLKTIEDALEIRRRILLAFEQAEAEPDPARRGRFLTFAIVGGGPTGVEMAGSIAELARQTLVRDFRMIHTGSARILLLEAGPEILPSFPPKLSAYAHNALQRLGVEVRCGVPVTGVDAEGVLLGGERIPAETVIWAAGVRASRAGKWLGADRDRAGRVKVAPDLSTPGHPDLFVIGDTALVHDESGAPLPGVAPVAKQQGEYVASVIAARVAGRAPPEPFRYRNRGNLATIGRKAAVVDFGRLHFTGYFAWLLWGVAHIFFLIGFRNRMLVSLQWLWAYLTFQRGPRLITGAEHGRALPAELSESEGVRKRG